MIEGLHHGYYYVLQGGLIKVYAAKGVGPLLKFYEVNSLINEEEIHRLARGRIDLDREEIAEVARKSN